METGFCEQCGKPLSENAKFCRICGAPVNVPTSYEQPASHYETSAVTQKDDVKNRKWIFAAVAAVIAIVAGGWWLSNRGNGSASGGAVDSTMVGDVAVPAGKYTIIIYNDNTGDFLTPSGGRICGFKLLDGRKDPMTLNLTKKILILGHNTDDIYIYRDRLFANYQDYYNYTSDYDSQRDTTAGIPITKVERDRTLIYAFDIPEGQIDKFNAPKHEIRANDKNEYTLVLYDDEHGHLFDSDGSHICGVEKRFGVYESTGIRLNKSLSLYGNSTDELYIKDNNLYNKYRDLLDDGVAYDGDISKRKAIVRSEDEGDAIFFHFSKTEDAAETIHNDRVRYTSSYGNSELSDNSISQNNKSSTNTLKMKGFLFVKNSLPTPSTVQLVNYIDPSNDVCQRWANALDLEGLEIAMYTVDCQNEYGALVRSRIIVFFKNGEPKYCEHAEKLKGDINVWRQYLKMAGL